MPLQPLDLAQRPTPVSPMPRLSASLGVDLWVKRDDLTGLVLSGNKVRKLDYLLADALEQGAEVVITCGGAQSNHARATAVACRQLGLTPVLLLRGVPTPTPEGNLLLDRLFGAEIHWCGPEDYRHRRQELMAQLAEKFRRQGRVPYVIPEGGSNALGARGYAAAGAELLTQAGRFDFVFLAVGSGGTLAGLALGPEIGALRGVAVVDDAATFHDRVLDIAAEAGVSLNPPGESWQVLDGYQGAGYGLCSAEVWSTIRRVAQAEGLLLDPVYTGKAMHALLTEVQAGRCGGRVLFWHTGGAFGVFGRGGEGVGD